MPAKRNLDDLPEVNSWAEVPAFESEAEEAAFWGSHAFGSTLLEQFRRRDTGSEGGTTVLPPRTRPLAVRFDTDVLARLRRLARRKHTGYQTLLKQFVVERLYEEEKREGILT
jgi:hypothetical protein